MYLSLAPPLFLVSHIKRGNGVKMYKKEEKI